MIHPDAELLRDMCNWIGDDGTLKVSEENHKRLLGIADRLAATSPVPDFRDERIADLTVQLARSEVERDRLRAAVNYALPELRNAVREVNAMAEDDERIIGELNSAVHGALAALEHGVSA